MVISNKITSLALSIMINKLPVRDWLCLSQEALYTYKHYTIKKSSDTDKHVWGNLFIGAKTEE